MADTLFPKREERVPYGSGTPAKRDRKNTKGGGSGETGVCPEGLLGNKNLSGTKRAERRT